MPALLANPSTSTADQEAALVLSELPGSYGSILLGTFGGLLLYGLSVHQTYRYMRSFSKDAVYIRWLVISVMILETLHLIATMHTCYFYLVQNYFAPLVLLNGVWSLDSLPLLSGILIIISQIFFVRRASLIGSRERIVAVVVAICLAGEFGFTIAAVIRAFIPPAKRAVRLLSTAGLGMASAADLALTLILFIAIWRNRKGGARPQSESAADAVQLYVINTGAATSLFNVLAFITALTLSIDSLVWVSLNIITTRLYANSLLAVLNSRELRGMEFFVSEGQSVTLVGPQFEDPANLWNAPKARSSSQSSAFDFQVTLEKQT
ncbi:hypothetical protein BD309DRAFT_962657 [Dichomitus squalens]|uniref:Uncharacterized protein n=2 Tax=Dichomitus squalens TaxID=114155 RepID=A0A4Q9NME1_9APHY|nr:uncharacterized protein DICSQDRAFT_174825 [Dichomitus squalens LYAD-421 SS1]EJF56512.1 hypothetical protein DICSQDRAFT_174825 [Dichomitus squalens LYAD-421 SS1]TBU25197.1 hypothetical protein BD311DRAFT_809387 [Dichomitus squalens]TBU42609.1 hypothetical protein BD309DRAFT_962657 [Dichomitus squalens]